MSDLGEVYIISVPKDQADKISPWNFASLRPLTSALNVRCLLLADLNGFYSIDFELNYIWIHKPLFNGSNWIIVTIIDVSEV